MLNEHIDKCLEYFKEVNLMSIYNSELNRKYNNLTNHISWSTAGTLIYICTQNIFLEK